MMCVMMCVRKKTWMAGTSPAMTMEPIERFSLIDLSQKFLFIIFVDAIFTTLFE